MLECVLGGGLETHDPLGVFEDFHPVGLINLLLDFLLHAGLYCITTEEIHSDEEIQEIREGDEDEVGTVGVFLLHDLHPVQDNLPADELRDGDGAAILQYDEQNYKTDQVRSSGQVIPRILVVDVLQHVHQKTGTVDHFPGAVDRPVTAGDDQLEVLHVVRLLDGPTAGLSLGLVKIDVSEQDLPLTQENFFNINIHAGLAPV